MLVLNFNNTFQQAKRRQFKCWAFVFKRQTRLRFGFRTSTRLNCSANRLLYHFTWFRHWDRNWLQRHLWSWSNRLCSRSGFNSWSNRRRSDQWWFRTQRRNRSSTSCHWWLCWQIKLINKYILFWRNLLRRWLSVQHQRIRSTATALRQRCHRLDLNRWVRANARLNNTGNFRLDTIIVGRICIVVVIKRLNQFWLAHFLHNRFCTFDQ